MNGGDEVALELVWLIVPQFPPAERPGVVNKRRPGGEDGDGLPAKVDEHRPVPKYGRCEGDEDEGDDAEGEDGTTHVGDYNVVRKAESSRPALCPSPVGLRSPPRHCGAAPLGDCRHR